RQAYRGPKRDISKWLEHDISKKLLHGRYIVQIDNSRYVKSKIGNSNPAPPTTPQPRAAQNAARARHHLTIKPPSPSPTS
ncbi:hypothetical protein, partial [Burkholderia vietnamiensis]|uniref:hypothetical protein n=1 Tax=Burkholderia vietnamiensis TaxID=60552 RepID=UPI001E56F61E